jgi:hypothetical protein
LSADKLAAFSRRLGSKPLTLTEKILYAHLANPEQDLVRGSSQLELQPQVGYLSLLLLSSSC